MPRARAKAKVSPKQDSVDTTPTDSTASNTNNNNNHTNERQGIKMAGLTPEQIQALLGQTRTKGVYIARLNDFLTSGEGGVCAHEEWVELRDKAPATVKQGFENAKNSKNAADGAENVKVITNEDKVYLINLGAAGAGVEA